MAAPTTLKVVILEYEELKGETTEAVRAKIAEAYGYDGLGILAVRGVPDFARVRAACLPMSYRFGSLPAEVKGKYEHAPSFYSFGWSHGKERLEGKPDTAKGSFYFNPVHDKPIEDEATIAKFPSFCHPNIWPTEDDCPGFVPACKAAAGLIVSVGAELARHCDAYVRHVDPTYGEHALAEVITRGRTHKARLLYYFPVPPTPSPDAAAAAAVAASPTATAEGKSSSGAGATDAPASPIVASAAPVPAGASTSGSGDSEEMSSWCGWHNDHGSLTGLTPAMYFDSTGREIPCPDSKAGLYIRTRTGVTCRVVVPSDCIAYQIGETAQVHTGGILQATPHCVRAANVEGVSRGTLAVFMEPEWHEAMAAPPAADKDRMLRGARGELLPRGVPQLVDRWDGAAQDFGGFTSKTLSMYY